MISIKHERTRWTSQRGVEFVQVDPQGKVYGTHPARDGWTDIRWFEVDLLQYDMDLIVRPNKTVPEIAKATGSEIAVNGPFAYITATNATPIGYRVRNGILEQKETSVPQWIDFMLGKDGKPRIAQLDPTNVDDVALAFSATSELVRDGQSYVNVYGEDTPADVRAGDRPRTALGIKPDGKLFFVVVDGDAGSDAGMTLPELARVMLALGAEAAMNLDGGGSSCLVHNGKEISGNTGDRRLGAAICFKRKAAVPSNPFADLPKYQDLRGKLPEHPSRRYVDLGIGVRTEIGIHHSLTDEGDAFSFARYHVNENGWPGVAYAFVILKDGTIQHCWDISMRTYHVGDSNKISVGVCLVGDFRDDEPTTAQRESLRLLHAVLVSQLPNYQRTRGHNEYPGYAWKPCPEFDYKSVIFGEPEPIEQPKKLYRVQVGAFGIKENAERLAEELKKAGYQTIIKEELK